MESIIGIKVPADATLSKCVSVVRGYEAISIADIKRRIENKDYLLKCGYTDRHDLKRLLGCCEALTKAGIEIFCFEHGRPCNMQFLKNLNGMYDEVAAEITAESMDEYTEV
ncbi:MAG: hypothetical protein Q4C54_05890 [Clostridia bacterium]|nr:hypothetical protein [Clostridia bacterium]